ncbi:MAG: hypothetical protein ACI9DF_004260 [Verrucomicrobiales bacterium]|jgi:hypothetical protein
MPLCQKEAPHGSRRALPVQEYYLRFRWQTSPSLGSGRFYFLVDDIHVDRLDESTGWRSAEEVLGPGTHVVRWSIYGRRWEDFHNAYLDSISFSEGEVSALAESLGGAAELVYTSVDALWVAQSEVMHEGVSAAASGLISHSQVSTLRVMTQAPGELSFWWEAFDTASFSIKLDDWPSYDIQTLSGETEWTQVTMPVDKPGWSEWEFVRDGSFGSGSNRVWLDQVAFTPDQNPQLAVGMDLSDESLLERGLGIDDRAR